MEQNRKKLRGLQKLAGVLEIPASSITNVTHMEIEGNAQIRLENSGPILFYNSEEIHTKTGKYITQFRGHDLKIRCMTVDCMEICGCITEIRFCLP